ncbi:MAG: chemotaxis protein CheX [Polyangiaceae bacterium]
MNEIRDIVIEASRHVFPSCGITIGDPRESAEEPNDTKQLVAFMGFAGPILRGTLAMVAPIELMRTTYPVPLKDGARWEFEVFDWSGEIANRLLANIKNGLAVRGVEIESSTPRVMLAEQLHVSRSVRGTVCSSCFQSGESWIQVWFDAMAPDNQKVLREAQGPSPTPPEGDVLLF